MASERNADETHCPVCNVAKHLGRRHKPTCGAAYCQGYDDAQDDCRARVATLETERDRLRVRLTELETALVETMETLAASQKGATDGG